MAHPERPSREHSQSPRLIPLQFRIVPKDIWCRVHVDVTSTIGSVKDTVLDKIHMPPVDPSLDPYFYEDARMAMSKQGLSIHEVRSFPKAFVARSPMRSLKEVLDAESQKRDPGTTDKDAHSKSKLSRLRNIQSKASAKRGAARAVLGGDPGEGGLGLMGMAGADLGVDVAPKASVQKDRQPPSAPAKKRNELRTSNQAVYPVDAAAKKEEVDATYLAGLDAYSDFYDGRLPGNEAAKLSEQEAMAQMREFHASSSPLLDRVASSHSTHPSAGSSPKSLSSSASKHRTDEEGSDMESGSPAEDLTHNVRAIALHSSSSESSLASHGKLLAGERARSGTIMLQDVRPHSAAKGPTTSSQEGQEGHTSDLWDRQYHGGLPRAPSQSSSLSREVSVSDLQREEHGLLGESHDSSSDVDKEPSKVSANSTKRLAGIYTDEISAWRDAQHGLNRFYSVHSYSNGHLLEDWRTVAAFRLRPFELLEIHAAYPFDKVHLPRIGEASDGTSLRCTMRTRSDPTPDGDKNIALDKQYLEPFCEGWCYIYKRGSGTSKAQRAGLGLWKLRWILVRGSKLSIFRNKPVRGAVEDEGKMWNLESIDAVFSEHADGATRPLLLPIDGLCRDILTITFRGLFVPPNSVHDESSPYQKPTISFRFVTQVDHAAFFATFARLHYYYAFRHKEPTLSALTFEWRRRALARATIAGLAGTVIPGKAARRRGRNALARSRLRPSGISREFDDADRWSSESESESIVPSHRELQFNYADVSLQDKTKLDALPRTPTVMSLLTSRIPVISTQGPSPRKTDKNTKRHSAVRPRGHTLAAQMQIPPRPELLQDRRIHPHNSSSQDHAHTADHQAPVTFSTGRTSGAPLRPSPSLTSTTSHDLRRNRYSTPGHKNSSSLSYPVVTGDDVDESFIMVTPSPAASDKKLWRASSPLHSISHPSSSPSHSYSHTTTTSSSPHSYSNASVSPQNSSMASNMTSATGHISPSRHSASQSRHRSFTVTSPSLKRQESRESPANQATDDKVVRSETRSPKQSLGKFVRR